jgi:hypothetical protein
MLPGLGRLVEDEPAHARKIVLEAIRRSFGNLSAAAKLLGTTYVVVNRMVRQLGLWSDVDALRRAAARRIMMVPEPLVPRHSGQCGPSRPHWVEDELTLCARSGRRRC